MEFVVFGIPYDAHIRRVSRELQKRGVDVHIVSSILPVDHTELTWTISSDGQQSKRLLRANGDFARSTKCLDGAGTVAWLRNKAYVDHINTEIDQATVLCIQERSAWLKGWIRTTGARWINPVAEALESEIKLTQLQTAASLGMAVPRSIISNQRDHILDFMNEGGEYIIKPLATATIPSHNESLDYFAVMTNVLSQEEVRSSMKEEWSVAPVIVQEKIVKSHELRVIQVGEAAFSVRIQSDHTGQVDHRRTPYSNKYEFVETPPALSQFGAQYLKRFGLDMGAFDYAVSPEGQHYFFECNPCGQWAWLEGVEENGNHEISKFVAEQFHRIHASLD
jgi:hypothetical protein